MTDHLRELILGLDDELTQGVIDQEQYSDLIRLVNKAVKRVFHNYPDYIKEADTMTERKLKFISEIMQEQEDKIALLNDKVFVLSDENSALSDENAILKARIMELQGQAVT